MALPLFGGRRRHDPFGSFLRDPFAFPSSLMRFPELPSFTRDVAPIATTQFEWKETSDSHIFKANFPGMGKKDVKVQVEDGHVLHISGEHKEEETVSSDSGHRVARAQSRFLHRCRLPDNAKVEEVKAAMEKGVLTVTVPKAASLKRDTSIQSIDISS